MKFCSLATETQLLMHQNPQEQGSSSSMRLMNNQYSKNRTSSSSSSSSSGVARSCQIDLNKVKQAEESLRTVMYLSCWGPN